jgi:hypothetical protein
MTLGRPNTEYPKAKSFEGTDIEELPFVGWFDIFLCPYMFVHTAKNLKGYTWFNRVEDYKKDCETGSAEINKKPAIEAGFPLLKNLEPNTSIRFLELSL